MPRLLSFMVAVGFASPLYAQDNTHEANTNTANAPIEETYVIGSRRGDFTIITEDAQKLVEVPGTFGDPLGAVFSLPGVVPSSGGGEPAVRGSSPADNTYIADFMPTSYVFHEFSQSVYSEFILQDFQLHAAGFGPAYSGVTGATFDITLRDPKNQDFGGVVDLSLLRSGIFLESGVTDSSSFYLSARQSMLHYVIKEQTQEEAEEDGEGIRVIDAPQDNDYQFKYLWNIADNHQLIFSANGASDLVAAELNEDLEFVAANPDFAGNAKIKTSFDSQSLMYRYTNGSAWRARLAVGQNDLGNRTDWGDNYHSDISTNSQLVKGEVSYSPNKSHELTLGTLIDNKDYTLDYEGILLICTDQSTDCANARREFITLNETLPVKETALYINEQWSISDSLWADVGAQWYDNNFTDESLVLPRLSLGFNVSSATTLVVKYGHYARLPELKVSFPGVGNTSLLTAKAKHSVLGIEQTFDDGWSLNAEIYYKTLTDLPLALDSAEDENGTFFLNEVTGTAMGLDVLINKDLTDKWYGWLALSLGKSERTNEHTGETKDYNLDTPWMLSWVTKYQFRHNMDISWRWSLRSGQAYTPIIGAEEKTLEGRDGTSNTIIAPVYGDPFSDNLPTYSRLDIRYTWDFTMWGLESSLMVDVLNTLNQDNVTERYLDYDQVNIPTDQPITKDETEIGITPVIGLRVMF